MFVWNLMSQIDKAELDPYNIYHCTCNISSLELNADALYLVTVWDLQYAQSKSGPARNVAQRIYRNIDENVRSYSNNLLGMKAGVAASVDRQKLAHPSIANDRLLKCLFDLGQEDEGLEQIEIEMFKYLKSRSNHPENIEHAITRGSG